MNVAPHHQLVDHLFRHESGKMVAVLTKLFGFDELDIAEDIVQDTFILAFEHWKIHGAPENPTAWLYAAAKNKSLDFIRRRKKFYEVAEASQRLIPIEYSATANLELAFQKITDNQLQMLFAVCHPAIQTESQVALALKTLCGFSLEEIAQSFLTNKETVKKRLQRAKDKIRAEKIVLEFPEKINLNLRLDAVLETIYLLFNEGYYSSSKEIILRKDLCLEAMRLCLLLLENDETNTP
jgi:RNA polymerase sigma-70 factor (ECF subfamily)